MTPLKSAGLAAFLILANSVQSSGGEKEEPYRPETGKFPPIEKAHAYRGELVFVDHANRRGSLRVEGTGKFYRNDPHPFALLPYGMVRYHDAPADLRDVPLGTVLHAHGFLPPDPKISAVPVLPTNNKDKDAELTPYQCFARSVERSRAALALFRAEQPQAMSVFMDPEGEVEDDEMQAHFGTYFEWLSSLVDTVPIMGLPKEIGSALDNRR